VDNKTTGGLSPAAESKRRYDAAVSWLSWIVVGFLAGVLAKGVTGRHRPGCLGTIVIGIIGGIVGGALFKAAGGEGINSFSLYSILVAFVGATVLLFAWGLLTRNHT
jgi:uncharacterized membrane protein YeaQ/YmgE (transglycosylase-associated protein family)